MNKMEVELCGQPGTKIKDKVDSNLPFPLFSFPLLLLCLILHASDMIFPNHFSRWKTQNFNIYKHIDQILR